MQNIKDRWKYKRAHAVHKHVYRTAIEINTDSFIINVCFAPSQINFSLSFLISDGRAQPNRVNNKDALPPCI